MFAELVEVAKLVLIISHSNAGNAGEERVFGVEEQNGIQRQSLPG